MPTLPRPTRSSRRSSRVVSLGVSLWLSLGASLSFGLACGAFSDLTELRESKRVSDCRLKSRRACRKLAKQDPSLEIDDCVSDRAWECALDNPRSADGSRASDGSSESGNSGEPDSPNETDGAQ